jgi:hypothetical protein
MATLDLRPLFRSTIAIDHMPALLTRCSANWLAIISSIPIRVETMPIASFPRPCEGILPDARGCKWTTRRPR